MKIYKIDGTFIREVKDLSKDLIGADLTGTDLEGADLTGADFTKAKCDKDTNFGTPKGLVFMD